MQRSIALLAARTVACSAPTGSRTSARAETPAPIVGPIRTGHADVNLTGAWATGSAGEPDAKQIVLTFQCNYSPALWIIQQDGDTLRAWTIPESHAQGIATTQAVTKVPTEGWIRFKIVHPEGCIPVP